VKEKAGQRSFLDIIRELLSGLSDNLDIQGNQSLACYYDGSIGMNKSEPTFNIFSQIGIHELQNRDSFGCREMLIDNQSAESKPLM